MPDKISINEKLIYWIPWWARPYESPISLYQKCLWINDSSTTDYKILRNPNLVHEEREALHERLYEFVDKQYRPIDVWLWSCARYSHAICIECLRIGYWSELPQMAGVEICPIHQCGLQHRCQHCLHPIFFGPPIFSKTAVFVCGACGRDIAGKPSDVSKTWHKFPNETIVYRFAELDALVQQISNATAGCYGFPCETDPSDQRLVLELLSNGRIREAHPPPNLFGMPPNDKVEAVTFILPRDKVKLTRELKSYSHSLNLDLLRRCEGEGVSPKNPIYSMTRFTAPQEYLDYDAKTSLAKNVDLLLEYFQKDLQNIKNTRSIILGGIQEGYPILSDQVIQDQVCDVVQAFSMWQITRILLCITQICEQLNTRIRGEEPIDDETQEFLDKLPYGIRLMQARMGDQRFRFYVPPRSWIPPFRIRRKNSEVELTVFQILPSALS